VSPKSKKSALPTEEIPIAQREAPAATARFPLLPALLVGISLGLGAVALVAGFMLWDQAAISSQTPAGETTDTTNANELGPEATKATDTTAAIDNVLGHLPYDEAGEGDLEAITPDGRVRLRTAAARKFVEMAEAARRDGINLAALSGYRTVEEQEYLFFGVKAERSQAATQRAEVSAPPGFSEHHTGYAVDLGDGNVPATHLSPDFEHTPAFKWLDENAARFNFELSFPRGNSQGIQYEPWHWRFVGDIDSLETFYRAQRLPKQAATELDAGASSPAALPDGDF